MKRQSQINTSRTRERYRIRPGTEVNAASYLVCPKCSEELSRHDIEQFMRCPYCNYRFFYTPELEVFMLQNITGDWEKQVSAANENKS